MTKRLTWSVPKSRLFGVPVPLATRTYKPVSHRDLANATIEAIKESGMQLNKQEYSWAKDGLEANARYTIKDIRDSEMELEIGWQNSYNKQLSLKFAIGTRIFICDNGCVSGNFGAFKKKHMGEVMEYAPAQIRKVIGDAALTFEEMKKEREMMKAKLLNRREKSEIIGRLFMDNQLINSTQLNMIRDEINKPTFDYKSPNTLWELYQYTTFSMKHLHPRLWMDDHIKVHKFFTGILEEPEPFFLDEDAGLVVDPAQIVMFDGTD